MGNSAWGHGYHQGFEAGAKRGGAVVGGVLLAIGGVIAAGKWGYVKLRERSLAEGEISRVEDSSEDGLPDAGGESALAPS